MTKYVVTGGTPLRGEVTLHGAKNTGFKVMIASLLADSPSKICDLGLISEIDFASQIISSIGGKVTPQKDPHCVQIDPGNVSSYEIPPEMSSKSRFSMMYAGPLLSRFGKVAFPQPGGDRFAKRPIDRHIEGLQALGAKVESKDNLFFASAPSGLSGTTYRFPKSTHNGTEALILAAVKAKGTTILENAAAEPEIDDLIKYLNAMGAKISRPSERTIKIHGVNKLSGVTHHVMPDRNEAVTYACMAFGTKGDIFVYRADPSVLKAFLDKVDQANGKVEITRDYIRFYFGSPLKSTNVIAVPYPGFMTDWQPLWATLMTQANGKSVVHETIYENRFDYVRSLVQMGAKIDYFEPKVDNPDQFYSFNLSDDSPNNKHAIKIFGQTQLSGKQVEVNDIRSGATALLAGMVAKGKTTIVDPKDQIKRGYEKLPENLVSLGAQIAQIDETPV